MTDAEFVEAVRTKPITEVLGVRCLILAIRDRDRLVALARQQLADAEARLIWWRDRWTSEQARVRELEKTLDNAAELKKIAACAARPLGDAMTSPQFRGGRGAARDPQSPASRSGTPCSPRSWPWRAWRRMGRWRGWRNEGAGNDAGQARTLRVRLLSMCPRVRLHGVFAVRRLHSLHVAGSRCEGAARATTSHEKTAR